MNRPRFNWFGVGKRRKARLRFGLDFRSKSDFFVCLVIFPFPGGAKGGPNGLGNCFALFVIECHNLKPFLVNFRPTGLRVDLEKFP